MELQPSLTVSQKLTLTPAMRQALRCLQLPIPELSELLQEEALSNPLLNAEPRSTPPERPAAPEIREDSIWRVGGQRDPEEDRTDHRAPCGPGADLSGVSAQAAGQNRLIDSHLRALCDYLVAVWTAGAIWTAPSPSWPRSWAVPCPIWNRPYSPCRCWTPLAWGPGTCLSV